MSFEFQLETLEGIQHLKLIGRLDSSTFLSLEKTINGLYQSADDKVLIDFSSLSYISSSGLRLILVAAKRARQVGGRLLLCELSPAVREVFEISGFLKIMETVDSKALAQDAFTA
jgi:anti-anti-sigma factor